MSNLTHQQPGSGQESFGEATESRSQRSDANILLSRALLGGVLLGLLGLHVATIQRQCLFVDEVSELRIAHLPTEEILVTADSMPPLFPLLQKLWLQFWQSDASLRWFSACCSMLTVVGIWKIANDELGTRASMAAAVLAATSPFLLYYSQFIRAYALYSMLFAWLLYFFLRASRSDRRRDWAMFVLLGIAGCYTHYYFPLYLLAAAVVLVFRRGLNGITPVAWISFVLIAMAALPLLPLLKIDMTYQQGLRETRPLNIAAVGYTYASFLTGYSLGPSKTELHRLAVADAVRLFLPWAALLSIAVLPLAYRGWQVLRARGLWLFIAMFLLLPVAIAGAVGQLLDLTYNVRFVAPCVVPLILWLAAGNCGRYRWHISLPALALLVTISGVAFANRHFVDQFRNEDIRSACRFVHQHSSGEEPVFVVADYMAHVARSYLPTDRPVYPLPDPHAMSIEIRSPELVQQAFDAIDAHTTGEQEFWFLYSREFHGDPQGLLLNALLEAKRVVPVYEAAGVRLFRGAASAQAGSSAEPL